LAAVAIGPTLQLEAADDAKQRPLLHVVGRHLGLLAPDFQVEPVGFVVAAATVHGHGEVRHHAAGFEITHLRVAAGSADQGDGIHAHVSLQCGWVNDAPQLSGSTVVVAAFKEFHRSG
jgi:hypothetical protein